jgi:protein ImuB
MHRPNPGSGWCVAVRLPCFRLAAALRHTVGPDLSAFLVERGGRRRVLEATGLAAAAGVRPGMPMREATRLVPRAAVVLDDPVRAARAWGRVMAVLGRLPGALGDGGPGLAYLRAPAGDAAERWFALLRGALEPLGLVMRCGAGSSRFVAFVAAHREADAVCPPGREAAFVADAPLELLGLADDDMLRLRLIGVRTLGQLGALPPGALGRFGADALRWNALARGQDEPEVLAGVW